MYNVQAYLDRCIESIISQTYKNFELILVDDKSTDNSPQICDEWQQKDSRVKVIHKEHNEGAGAARNTGIENASGDYIAFFDSDDFFDRELLRKAVTKLVSEETDIAWFGVNIYFGEKFVFPMPVAFPKDVYEGRDIQDELIPDVLDGSRNGKVRGLLYEGGPKRKDK